MSTELKQGDLFKDQEWRVAVVRVSLRNILNMFFNQRGLPSVVELCRHNLPEGCEIVSINPNWRMNVLEVQVRHPSFEVVPDGAYPPDLGVTWEWGLFALATREELEARDKIKFPD